MVRVTSTPPLPPRRDVQPGSPSRSLALADRRGSGESRRKPPLVHPHPAHAIPGRASPSVFSGREGSIISRRGELHSPPPAELEQFAALCRAFYFSLTPPEGAADAISRTLANLPPAHRATYTRLQSQLRSQAHLHHLRVRISTLHALLSATQPGGSLSPSARADPAGPRARAERFERAAHFVRTWGAASGGLEPFFRGLWSVIRVQSRPKRGAGAKRVVWELDDAILLESGGPEFMHEAVTTMKGVLGFEERALEAPPVLRRYSGYSSSPSTPSTPTTPTTPTPGPGARAGAAQRDERDRSGSDPFTDKKRPPPPPVPVSRRARLAAEAASLMPLDVDEAAAEEADLNKPRFRLWVFPAHISDEEAEDLLALFPVFRTRGKKADARLPKPTGISEKTMEEGAAGERWRQTQIEGQTLLTPREECEDALGVLRSGAGRMWAGEEQRVEGWGGGRWFRFKRWWRVLFGRG